VAWADQPIAGSWFRVACGPGLAQATWDGRIRGGGARGAACPARKEKEKRGSLWVLLILCATRVLWDETLNRWFAMRAFSQGKKKKQQTTQQPTTGPSDCPDFWSVPSQAFFARSTSAGGNSVDFLPTKAGRYFLLTLFDF